MAALNLFYMAKSKTKADYITMLKLLVTDKAKKLTVKQIKQLIAKYQ